MYARPPMGRRPAHRDAIAADATALGGVFLFLVVCASLAPFRFDAGILGDGWRSCMGRMRWAPLAGEDLAANVLIFLPIGITLFGCARSRIARAAMVLPTAVAAGAILCLALEVAQTMIPARRASWTDWTTCVSGVASGAALAAVLLRKSRTLLASLHRRVADCLWSAAAVVLTCGLIVYAMTPFDVIADSIEFKRSLADSRWWPIAEREAVPTLARVASPDRAVLSTIGTAGAFALLGGVQIAANRRRAMDGRALLAAAMGHTAIVAVIIESLQLFLASRTFDTTELTANVAAGAAGALGAFVWTCRAARASELPRRVERLASATGSWLYVAAVCGLFLIALAFGATAAPCPTTFSDWAPFAVYEHLPPVTVFGHLTASVLVSALLTTTLAWCEWKRWNRIRWSAITLAVACAVLTYELVKSASSLQICDLSNVGVGLMTVMACRLVHRSMMQRLPVPSRTVPRAG